MKSIIVRVPWTHGLDLRPAAVIARVAQRFRSRVVLKRANLISDANSILGLVVLCATLSCAVTIEAEGEDEAEAVKAVAACFEYNLSKKPPE